MVSLVLVWFSRYLLTEFGITGVGVVGVKEIEHSVGVEDRLQSCIVVTFLDVRKLLDHVFATYIHVFIQCRSWLLRKGCVQIF